VVPSSYHPEMNEEEYQNTHIRILTRIRVCLQSTFYDLCVVSQLSPRPWSICSSRDIQMTFIKNTHLFDYQLAMLSALGDILVVVPYQYVHAIKVGRSAVTLAAYVLVSTRSQCHGARVERMIWAQCMRMSISSSRYDGCYNQRRHWESKVA
jgi:hypothetical protein